MRKVMMMKAAIVTGQGLLPVYGDFEHPKPVGDERLIHVSASALSHLTKGRAAGRHYSADNSYPFVPGVDGVGRLDGGGRVYFVLPRAPFGAMSQQTVVDAARCIPVPDDLDDITAAAIANPGMSSWAALRHRARIKPGETILINGATGSSGQLAVSIARHLGAGRVIATGRNSESLNALRANGADEAVSLLDDDVEARLRPHFVAGVDVVLDYLWGESARSILNVGSKVALAARPIRFVQIGAMSGGEIALPASILRSSAIEIMGSGIGSVSMEDLAGSIRDLLAVASTAGLKVAARPVPLAKISQTWNETEDAGRIVFTM